jgi:hypothetical protein
MINICIPREIAQDVLNVIRPAMNSEERKRVIQSILGDERTSHEINKRFEATMLLKKQDKFEDNFLEKASGSKRKIETIKSVKASYEERLKKIYNPDGTINENFKSVISKSDTELKELAQKGYNIKYSIDIPETIKINGQDVDTVQYLTKLQDESKVLAQTAKGTADGSPEKLAEGMKLVEMQEILEDIQHSQKSYSKDISLAISNIGKQFSKGDVIGGIGSTVEGALDLALTPTLKSIKASLDHSVLLRQGLKVLSANPEVWVKNAKKSTALWGNVFNKEAEQQAVRAFKADMMTRDLYKDAVKSKLAIGVMEDFFPKSPVHGLPFFRTSDEVFTMFSQGSRMDLFESYVKMYKSSNSGAMPTQEIMDSFAKIANSTTGRGGLGNMEAAASTLNKILFSARYQTANINTVRHAFSSTIAPEARKIAQKQLARHITLLTGTMATLSAFGDVGWDPRESNFGKVRLGDSKKWVDVTGGLASYISVIGKTAKTTLGKQKYGQDSGMDILVNFMKGKLAPAPGVVRDILEQRDFSGKAPTTVSTLRSLFTPITIDNVVKDIERNEEVDTALISLILEAIGMSATEPKVKNFNSQWSPSDIIK